MTTSTVGTKETINPAPNWAVKTTVVFVVITIASRQRRLTPNPAVHRTLRDKAASVGDFEC